jgi:hypothetical protein
MVQINAAVTLSPQGHGRYLKRINSFPFKRKVGMGMGFAR